ncbi:MAG: hypothetical protein M3Q56_00280 [Bacteroidota bacterium]|nr:hypothetical protein [Bacteroidota bacterium]
MQKNLIRIQLLIAFLWFTNLAYSQQTIVIHEEPGITNLMEQYKRINRSISHVSGWRITVINTADRRAMEEAKTNFNRYFSYRTKWEYKEPYYQLKAGAFISRNEANGVLESVKKKFPGAFLSIDKIPYDEL